MTETELNAIEARINVTTPWNWQVMSAFIVSARIDIPLLLAEIRRLQAVIKDSEGTLTIAYLSGLHDGGKEQEKEDDLK
jgi:hypothetical protein